VQARASGELANRFGAADYRHRSRQLDRPVGFAEASTFFREEERMIYPRTATAALTLGFVLAWAGTTPAETDRATPQEVIQRVQQAAQDLAHSGEAGLATFASKNDTSVSKDSYTFVVSCEGGTAVAIANPVRPDPTDTPMAQVLTFGPKSGAQIAADFCSIGRQPNGWWVEYNFPELGATRATRKVSYLLAVEGGPYVVGAGLHDEKAKIDARISRIDRDFDGSLDWVGYKESIG
jgi:cytochrome c